MSRITIPVIDLSAIYRQYQEELKSCMDRVVESGWYILGKEVAEFEREFARWLGVKHIVGVASGTDAIVLALRSLGIGSGDAVFTVSHTAVATVAAIELAGATPVLIDVDAATRNIDVHKLSETLRRFRPAAAGPRPRAVIAVHLYGHACDLHELKRLCGEENLELIEDCAQAHGTKFGDARVGSFGSAAAFSFYPTKNLGALGDAGAIAFRDPATADRCRALREYGWSTRYVSEFPGFNSRLDELQAAVLVAKLRFLDGDVAARQAVARTYDEALSGVLEVPSVSKGTTHSYHLYVARCAGRDSLRSSLENAGIGSAVHYPVPVHLQPAYANRVALGAGGLAVTEALARDVISLPMHPFLSQEDAHCVIDAIKAWRGGRTGASA